MSFKAVKITDKVWWVGAIDWNLKEFHGYHTHRGTTYNAYLVLGEKPTLIDTVKAPFKEEMYSRIASVMDPSKIEIIVSNHAEPDHSGALADAIADLQPEKVYASVAGVRILDAQFHIGEKLTAVKTGDSIDLGGLSLSFVETKMLHWPDSMFSYLKEEKILFTQDGFGMHLATDRLFIDENPWDMVEEEMEKYYANILLLYSPQVLKLLEVFPSLNLDVQYIATDHGPVWRGADVAKPLELYRKFAEQEPAPVRRKRSQAVSEREQEEPVRKQKREPEISAAERKEPARKPSRKPQNFLADDDEFEFEFLNMDDKDL